MLFLKVKEDKMYQVGIDIGSSSAKTAVLKGGEIIKTILLDTGFSSRKVADEIYAMLEAEGITRENAGYVATGYGRVSVPYADDMCTVFAESEVIILIGKETPREDIAFGVIESVVHKVVSLLAQVPNDRYFLTGGLCEDAYIIGRLAKALDAPVSSLPLARYAGAIGAALLCK